jgi:hypothetical protein
MDARNVYLKRTEKNGKTTITEHRVWSATKFVKSQIDQAKQESATKPDEAYVVVQVTEREYLESRKPS